MITTRPAFFRQEQQQQSCVGTKLVFRVAIKSAVSNRSLAITSHRSVELPTGALEVRLSRLHVGKKYATSSWNMRVVEFVLIHFHQIFFSNFVTPTLISLCERVGFRSQNGQQTWMRVMLGIFWQMIVRFSLAHLFVGSADYSGVFIHRKCGCGKHYTQIQ